MLPGGSWVEGKARAETRHPGRSHKARPNEEGETLGAVLQGLGVARWVTPSELRGRLRLRL